MKQLLCALSLTALLTLLDGCTPHAVPEWRQLDAGRHIVFLCENGQSVSVTFRNGAAQLESAGKTARLAAKPVGSGIHYAGDGHDLRGKGPDATWTAPSKAAVECRERLSRVLKP